MTSRSLLLILTVHLAYHLCTADHDVAPPQSGSRRSQASENVAPAALTAATPPVHAHNDLKDVISDITPQFLAASPSASSSSGRRRGYVAPPHNGYRGAQSANRTPQGNGDGTGGAGAQAGATDAVSPTVTKTAKPQRVLRVQRKPSTYVEESRYVDPRKKRVVGHEKKYDVSRSSSSSERPAAVSTTGATPSVAASSSGSAVQGKTVAASNSGNLRGSRSRYGYNPCAGSWWKQDVIRMAHSLENAVRFCND